MHQWRSILLRQRNIFETNWNSHGYEWTSNLRVLYIHCEMRKKWDFTKRFLFIFTRAQLQQCTIELVLNRFSITDSCTIESVSNSFCRTDSCTIGPVLNRFCITVSCTIQPVSNRFCITDSCTIEPVLNRWRVQSIRCSVILMHNRFVRDRYVKHRFLKNRPSRVCWPNVFKYTKPQENLEILFFWKYCYSLITDRALPKEPACAEEIVLTVLNTFFSDPEKSFGARNSRRATLMLWAPTPISFPKIWARNLGEKILCWKF